MPKLRADEVGSMDDDAVFGWYGGTRNSTVLTCPVCFAAVAAVTRAARGHMEWHEAADGG